MGVLDVLVLLRVEIAEVTLAERLGEADDRVSGVRSSCASRHGGTEVKMGGSGLGRRIGDPNRTDAT
jgi:hypothetical protein